MIILAGANLGEPQKTISEALNRVKTILSVGKVSSFYRSAPWGMESRFDFINQAWLGDCSLSPAELMDALLGIEKELGRERDSSAEGYQDRIIDLDILDFGGMMSEDPKVLLPHPRLTERAFALAPLQELNPEWVHPKIGLRADELLAKLKQGGLERI